MTIHREASLPPHLELREAGRRWGSRTALERLSLTVPAGECIALVGPSGSGKTTLLRLLAGALEASEGAVLAGGEDFRRLGHRRLQRYRARCGIVSQSHALVRQLSVHHNVVAGLLAEWPWYKAAASLFFRTEADRVAKVLAQVGLADRQWDPVAILSGGQQQRVAVSRALVRDPLLVLADEPTASLDPSASAGLIDLLVGQSRQRGATLVLSTHHLDQVVGHVDRVIGLREGRVSIDSRPSELDDAALDALYSGSDERQ